MSIQLGEFIRDPYVIKRDSELRFLPKDCDKGVIKLKYKNLSVKSEGACIRYEIDMSAVSNHLGRLSTGFIDYTWIQQKLAKRDNKFSFLVDANKLDFSNKTNWCVNQILYDGYKHIEEIYLDIIMSYNDKLYRHYCKVYTEFLGDTETIKFVIDEVYDEDENDIKLWLQ